MARITGGFAAAVAQGILDGQSMKAATFTELFIARVRAQYPDVGVEPCKVAIRRLVKKELIVVMEEKRLVIPSGDRLIAYAMSALRDESDNSEEDKAAIRQHLGLTVTDDIFHDAYKILGV